MAHVQRAAAITASTNLTTAPADALSNAVLNGDLTRVGRLLENGANPNMPDTVRGRGGGGRAGSGGAGRRQPA